jgi:hypothetical protein
MRGYVSSTISRHVSSSVLTSLAEREAAAGVSSKNRRINLNSAENVLHASAKSRGSGQVVVQPSRRNHHYVPVNNVSAPPCFQDVLSHGVNRASNPGTPHFVTFTYFFQLKLALSQVHPREMRAGVSIDGRKWARGTLCEYIFCGRACIGTVDLFFHASVEGTDLVVVAVKEYQVVSTHRDMRTVSYGSAAAVATYVPALALAWLLALAPHLGGDATLRDAVRVTPIHWK